MARTQTKAKQGSLAALAAGLDTKKRPLPPDAKPQSVEALRDAVKARVGVAEKAPAPVKVAPPVAPKPRASAPKAAAVKVAPPVAPKPRASAPKSAAVRAPLKPEAPSVVRPAGLPSVSRAAALSSLQRTPSAPVKVAAPKVVSAPNSNNTRRYPRATIEVRARLSLADNPARTFEATLPTVNISVGGLFLESSFFLKLGTRLNVELQLPPKGRSVHVKAEVVRVETNGGGSGFALRFTEYFDGSEVVLATHFLSPVLKEFITAYAKQHRFDASAEYIAHTADVLAAWELKKAELGGDVWSLTPST